MPFRPLFSRKCYVVNRLQLPRPPVLSGRCWFDTLCTARQSLVLSDTVLFLYHLFVWFGMSDHFLFKHLLHSLFYPLEKDLRNPATQGVDCVQELGLDGVEERLEHVVFKGKLQRQRHYYTSVLVPKLSQSKWYLQIRQLGSGQGRVGSLLIINYDTAHL